MANARFPTRDIALAHYCDALGWKPVPGMTGAYYEPTSFDRNSHALLRVVTFDAVGHAFVHQAFYGGEVLMLIRKAHRAICGDASSHRSTVDLWLVASDDATRLSVRLEVIAHHVRTLAEVNGIPAGDARVRMLCDLCSPDPAIVQRGFRTMQALNAARISGCREAGVWAAE